MRANVLQNGAVDLAHEGEMQAEDVDWVVGVELFSELKVGKCS